jgi:hypothetical protein
MLNTSIKNQPPRKVLVLLMVKGKGWFVGTNKGEKNEYKVRS